MKIRITISFLFLTTLVYAQYDSVFVEIEADTVTVWNTLVSENCVFIVDDIVEINDNTITIIEQEKSTLHANCNCFYDFSIKLINLESNDYVVNVYRKYTDNDHDRDSLYYIGTTNFSYHKSTQDSLSKKYFQSECYVPQSIENKEIIPKDLFLLTSYPNPFNSQIKLKIYIPSKSLVALKLYDLSGKLIKTFVSEILSNGNHVFLLNAENYSSGNYIVSLEADKVLRKSIKILLIK